MPVVANAGPEDHGRELLLYGLEQILRAADTGVLVAFAGLAFQQLRDVKQPHHEAGVGLLLVSVFLCAIVHFSIGHSYLSRARRLIRRPTDADRAGPVRLIAIAVAILAGLIQFACIVVALIVLLASSPPEWLLEAVRRCGFPT
jgi:hypothetical protein